MSAIDQDFVRDLIERHSDASGGNGRDFHNGAYVAIADELNATLGSCNCSNSERTGTCHDLGGTGANGEQVFDCSECGCVLSLYDRDGTNTLCTHFICDYPRYCPECGRKVVWTNEHD